MATMRDGMARMLRGETPPPPAATLIGMALSRFADGEAVVDLTVHDGQLNPMGTVQGGILAALADAAMGWAFMTTLGEGESYATLEMKTNFLKPVRKGRLSARARVKKAGRTAGLVECDVVDEAESLVAYAVGTCLILRGDAAAGR
jgi:uncharacterized protein (TIGR00369 family)